jgi:hypothetical protein
MQQRLQRRRNGNYTTIPTDAALKWKDYLNEVHRTVLGKPGMESLRYGILTFASVASQQPYALPAQGIARINRIWETTNDIKLVYRTLAWLRDVDPDPVPGTSCYWIPTGFAEVHTQPSDASSVFVDSTAAGDTTQTAYVEGITSGGYFQSKSVTLTGTTAVNISAAVTDWIQITKFYLSAAAAGTVTLHEDASGGTELAKIAIGDVRAQYHRFLLYPTPSAVITYTVDVLRAIPEMTIDTDEPLLPEDYHDLLLDMAELKDTKKADDPSRYAMLKDSIRDRRADLQTFVTLHPDWTPEWTQREPVGRAAFAGGWFPVQQ